MLLPQQPFTRREREEAEPGRALGGADAGAREIRRWRSDAERRLIGLPAPPLAAARGGHEAELRLAEPRPARFVPLGRVERETRGRRRRRGAGRFLPAFPQPGGALFREPRSGEAPGTGRKRGLGRFRGEAAAAGQPSEPLGDPNPAGAGAVRRVEVEVHRLYRRIEGELERELQSANGSPPAEELRGMRQEQPPPPLVPARIESDVEPAGEPVEHFRRRDARIEQCLGARDPVLDRGVHAFEIGEEAGQEGARCRVLPIDRRQEALDIGEARVPEPKRPQARADLPSPMSVICNWA